MVASLCGCATGDKVFIKNYAGYYGLCDENGDYFITPKYKQMIGLDNGRYLVCLTGSEYLKICTLVENDMTDCEFVNEYSRIYTIINKKDKVLETLEDIAYVEEIADGLIVMLKNVVRDTEPRGELAITTYGYISAECYLYDSALNKLNAKPWYNVKMYGEDKLILTDDKGLCYITDLSLNYISTKGYEDIYYITDDLCGVVENSKHGIMNMNGEVVVTPKYTAPVMGISESLIAVGESEKLTLVSSQSLEATSNIIFTQIENFNYYGVARIVLIEGEKVKYGLVDNEGKTVIDTGIYAYISQFSGGKAVACIGESSTNTLAADTEKMRFDIYPDMSFTYPDTENFSDHRSLDKQPEDATWVLIDTEGNVIREATKDDIAMYDVK